MTETTEPDPQVEWGPSCPVCGNLPDQPDAHWPTCGNASFRRRVLTPYKPLTVADIPRGEGCASLFLARDEAGELDLCERLADGGTDVILWSHEMPAALRDHLSATLPTIGPKGSV